MTKAGWEWWRCAGEVPAGQCCHISAWPEAGSKVPGAAGNVAGLNPMGSTGQWGGLDPRAGSCLRPSLGCCCLLKALAGDGGVRRLDKALPRQHFLRWALFVIAGAPCALPGDGGCHPWCFPSYWPVLIPLPAAAGAGGTGSPLPPLGEQDGLHGVVCVDSWAAGKRTWAPPSLPAAVCVWRLLVCLAGSWPHFCMSPSHAGRKAALSPARREPVLRGSPTML